MKTYPVFQDAGLKVVFICCKCRQYKEALSRDKEQIGVSLGSVKTSWMNLQDVALFVTLKRAHNKRQEETA